MAAKAVQVQRRITIGFNTQNGPSDAGWFGDHFLGKALSDITNLSHIYVDISSAFFGPPKNEGTSG